MGSGSLIFKGVFWIGSGSGFSFRGSVRFCNGSNLSFKGLWLNVRGSVRVLIGLIIFKGVFWFGFGSEIPALKSKTALYVKTQNFENRGSDWFGF